MMDLLLPCAIALLSGVLAGEMESGFVSISSLPVVVRRNRHQQQDLRERFLVTTNNTTASGAVDLQNICSAVQFSFKEEVYCTCAGIVTGSFSMSCDYQQSVCSDTNAGKLCGKPQLAVSMVEGRIFSATTCVSNYTRGVLPLQDTCVFVDACPDNKDGFCDCTASYGGKICDKCQVCEGGHALTVDCSNVNLEAISTQCSAVDLDLSLAGGSGIIAGFAPTFSGFCSQLEQALNNRISCDCTDAVGDNFSITCKTDGQTCAYENNQLCATVQSTVAVVASNLDKITTCATYDAPYGETCTDLQLCKSGVCGCSATYNGNTCNSCSVCQGGDSITLDCSNVDEKAVVQQCQPVNASTSYEFLPKYAPPQLSFNTARSSAGQAELAFNGILLPLPMMTLLVVLATLL